MIQYYTALGRYALRAEEIRHLPIITSPRGASQICVTWYNFFTFRNKKSVRTQRHWWPEGRP